MRFFVFLCILATAGGFLVVNASVVSVPIAHSLSVPEPRCTVGALEGTQVVTARSWQVVEISSGQSIAEHAADLSLPFASVVKLITAHVVLQQPEVFSHSITLTTGDIATEGRSGNLAAGQEYTHHELLLPLLLTSSNDAGAALARAYPNLLSDMQEFVEQTGAVQTTIADTTGLRAQNRTTARDLAVLLRALFLQSPHIFDISRTTQVISRYENGWVNNIPFRTLAGYEGGKQGFLPESGQTGVAVFTLDHDNPFTFGIVLLGSDSVAKDMELLHQAVTQSYYCTPSVVTPQ